VPSPKRSASPRATSTLQWWIGLKALDPERPIREADIKWRVACGRQWCAVVKMRGLLVSTEGRFRRADQLSRETLEWGLSLQNLAATTDSKAAGRKQSDGFALSPQQMPAFDGHRWVSNRRASASPTERVNNCIRPSIPCCDGVLSSWPWRGSEASSPQAARRHANQIAFRDCTSSGNFATLAAIRRASSRESSLARS
jgi:hypothetical protein